MIAVIFMEQKYKGKYPNEFADISFMSLQGQKAISGGEGGLILTNSENYYKKMIELNLSWPSCE